MIGSVIDRYEVLQRLGEGATATVYRGRHVTIGREVAIKVLHPHLGVVRRYRDRFQREARAVGRLNHPNIVSILDFSGPQAEECYLVTELVDGVTLLELMEQRGRLPSELAAVIAADLAGALGYAHREGIIHRDLKPANVMIRRDGRVKLMDFGVARVLDEASLTMDGALLGSPAYMSPEQASDGPLDGRSDLFSLGSVLFHAVTGHTPFAGSTPPVILRNVTEGARQDVQVLAMDVCPALAGVIERLLQVDRADRPPDAEEGRALLLATLEATGLSPSHPTLDLHAWLRDGEGAAQALRAHVSAELLARGRARLAAGDTLEALRLLNRLLAMDEDNAEVFTLVQGLHRASAPPRRTWAWVSGAALALLTGGGALAWAFQSPEPAPTSSPVAASGVAPPGEPALTATTPDPTRGIPAPAKGAPVPVPRLPTPAPPPEAARGSAAAPRLPGTTDRARVQETSPRAPAEASLVLQVATPVEVWVDGTPRGAFRMGPSEDRIATRARPLPLPAGERLVSLRNNGAAETWEQRLTLAPGETRVLEAHLRRKPVTFQIDPTLPVECRVRVGSTAYGTVREFGASLSIREPEAGTRIHFTCPPPVGEFSEAVGTTFGGEFIVVPRAVPRKGP